MRISTNTFYESGVGRISDLQNSLVKTQQQISSGKRLLSAADDPVAASQILQVTQSQAVNDQLVENRKSARDSLSLEESSLQGVTGLIQTVQTLTVSAGNAALDDSQRKYLASELQGHFDELLGLANSRDGLGNYLFSGYQTSTAPYTQSASGAQYAGDQGQRQIQVGGSRQLPISDSGDQVFENVRSGNGTFKAAPATTNVGSGIVSPGSVTNYAALTGHNYDINFNVVAGVTTYDIVDTTVGLPALSTGNAFTPGQPIVFAGQQVEVRGTPANGDKFNVTPSSRQSLFGTITNLITALNTPVAGAGSNAVLTNSLNIANGELSGALDNVLSVRASVGTRLQELDSLDSGGEDRKIQYATTLSGLQDLDYAKAITELTQTQTTLEAAQKSFVKISGLSLFSLL